IHLYYCVFAGRMLSVGNRTQTAPFSPAPQRTVSPVIRWLAATRLHLGLDTTRRNAGAGKTNRRSGSGPPGMLWQLAHADHLHACFRHRVVVLDRAAAHADGADEHAVLVDDGKAAREGNQPFIGMLDAVERLARLGQLAELAGGHAKKTGSLGLLDGGVGGANPPVVHSQKRLLVGAGADHSYAPPRLMRDGPLCCT